MMNPDSLVATEKMLDVVKILLDEQEPDTLFPKILNIAREVLNADAAVLDIGGEVPLHFSDPEKVSISISAVRHAKSENRAIVWNQLDDDSADLSKSIVQNQLTSIMVSPFRTPDSESGYLYLQRAARTEARDGRGARVGVGAALEHDGPRARAGEQQRGEHAGRAEADDEGTLRGRFHLRDRVALLIIRRDVRAFAARERLLLAAAERDGERADVVDIIFPARVERALDKPRLRDILAAYAELFRRARLQRLRRLARREAQIPDQDHVPSLPASAPLAQAHCRL